MQKYLTTTASNDPVLAVGRFKGKKLSEVPKPYLNWLIQNVQCPTEKQRMEWVKRNK